MPISKFANTGVSLTSGSTVAASSFDLGEQGWQTILAVVPSMPSGSFHLWGSSDDSTYYRVLQKDSTNSIYIADSSVVANGCIVEVTPGFRYLKPGNSSGVTDATTDGFEFICSY